MPDELGKHSHIERHFGLVPLHQSRPWFELLVHPDYPYPNSAGAQLKDVTDGTDPQDAVTVSQLTSTVSVDGGNRDLITGDSATFESSLGDWTDDGAGGTLTWETATGWPDPTVSGSAQMIFDDLNQVAKLPITGPFVEGQWYEALLAINFPDPASEAGSLDLVFGSTDEMRTTVGVNGQCNGDRFALFAIRWLAEADHATAALYLISTSLTDPTVTIRLGRAGAARLRPQDRLGYGVTHVPRLANDTDDAITTGIGLVVFPGTHGSPNVRLSTGMQDDGLVIGDSASLTGASKSALALRDSDGQVFVDGTYVYAAAPEAATGDLTFEGVELDIGEDYLGLFIGEKDVDTIQLYPGWSDAELRDNDPYVWIIDGGGP